MKTQELDEHTVAFKGDAADETTEGSGGGGFTAAPRGVYWLQIVDAKKTKTSPQAKNPGVPLLKFILEVADDDSRDALGKKVWHSVALIARGNDEKAAKGHGMAVHWFKACKLPLDGKPFDIDVFVREGHCMVHAFLEEDSYEKVVNGKTFTNPCNKIREVYTDTHPAPQSEADWPPLPKPKPVKKPAAGGAGKGDIDEELGF